MKAKFYRQFYIFFVYFLISLAAFGLRPKAYKEEDDDGSHNSTEIGLSNGTLSSPVQFVINNMTEILCNYTVFNEAMSSLTNATTGMHSNGTVAPDVTDMMDSWNSFSECPLLDISTTTLKVKLAAEGVLTIFALYYILTAFRELRFLGAKMFFENLVSQQTFILWKMLLEFILVSRLTFRQSTAPSRVMFLFSCWLMLTVPLLKFFCLSSLEDHVSVIIMLTTSPYFLFFCRFGFNSFCFNFF